MQFSKVLLPLLALATSGVISAPATSPQGLAIGNMMLVGRDMVSGGASEVDDYLLRSPWKENRDSSLPFPLPETGPNDHDH